jgi:hypothetical protein
MADYCVYWFRKAHDHLPACTSADPVAGRAGLVGTQNIRNNQSRVGGLDYAANTGTIVEAVDNQPWSGEANVHVSIANWAKTQNPALLPNGRKLWFKVERGAGTAKPRKRGSGPATKEYQLDCRKCSCISSALSDQTDVSVARPLKCNTIPLRALRGLEPGSMGFLLNEAQREKLLADDPASAKVIKPYLTGDELVEGGQPERWLIDFQRIDMLKAMEFKAAFQHVRATVLPQMTRISAGEQGEAADEFGKRMRKRQLVARTNNWWQLRRCVPDTVGAIEAIPRYIGCSRVTKRPIFAFLSNQIRPAETIAGFALSDDYSFGVLQSHAHWLWFITKCGKLTERFRYSIESVFDTFPWPQTPTPEQVQAVAEAGRVVRRVRGKALSLRALYRTLELPGANPLKDAHAALDAAVLAAYGFSAKKDLLAQLLELNLAVAQRIEKGESVTPPGIPANFPKPETLISEDCIRPPRNLVSTPQPTV